LSIAFWLVAFAIAAAPSLVLLNGPLAHGTIGLVTAGALAANALNLRPGERSFFSAAVRPFMAAAAVPAVWIAFQLLPLPKGLAHPIWDSTAAALGRPLFGSITMDVGATVLALGRWLTFVAFVLAVAGVAIDRLRAERLLILLVLAGVGVTLAQMAALLFANPPSSSGLSLAAADGITIGALLSAAGTIAAFERHETRSTQPNAYPRLYVMMLWASVVALALQLVALAVFVSKGTLLATAVGLVSMAALVVIRRLGLGGWAVAVLGVSLLLALAALTAAISPAKVGAPAVALASNSSPGMLAVTERMLSARLWAGTGAGTFSVTVPLYKDVDEIVQNAPPPTAAAALAVELGHTALWGAVLLVLAGAVVLLRGALARGRDSFYPTLGIGILLTSTVQAFVDSSFFGIVPSILLAAALGLALAQRASRTSAPR
jgi:hypothetical protein